ncbi:hypothetical protein MSG28_009047 [Choristoneura fumiferana]|uniref:Uncharacterized protein n=1 Tax=Choristoneura fumiferana TaxID=7141 RepID=A0ACC0KWI9_CHOFU|nr:hypothetical protein MSG28_009047 [Choristoneura fumiferana]
MLFQNTIAFATRFIITDLRIFEAIPNMTMFFQDFSCSDSFIITDLRIFEAIPNMTMFFQDFSCSDKHVPEDDIQIKLVRYSVQPIHQHANYNNKYRLIRKKRDKKINVANFNNEEMLKITNQSVPNNKNK